ncbi:hypothetical protein H4R99_001284 [Coemansia sp. RSA 1722]|nr:hypothetical protein LPJ57_000543 [Coemansia sp. RSA 486]KAJ2236964.1 hypothetical protein IWW45_001363 [Coemansia sp. RSA 485]KAJ2605236.1 hypothetical protein H4R99_001284 [Coemansia sp. RSA 1722]
MSHFNALPFPATNAELPEPVVQALEQLDGPLKDSNNATYELARPLERSRYSACPSCGISFNLFRRKNNCVNCGQVVCSDCLSHRWYLPKYGLKTPVVCCSMCNRNLRMSIKSKRELQSCSVRELRAYLQLYGLYKPTMMLEKSDLVAAVYGNSPMPQVNEAKYRESLPQPSQQSEQTQGGRQQQQHNRSSGYSRSRSRNRSTADAHGDSSTNWDRMFNTIGSEIGRGMENLVDGLADAFDPSVSSDRRQRPPQPGFFQPPRPPQPPTPPNAPQFQSHGSFGGGHFGEPPSYDSHSYSHSYSHSGSNQSQSQSQSQGQGQQYPGPWPQSVHNSAPETSRQGSRNGPSASSTDVVDLRELVRSGENVSLLSIKTLKALLVKNHVDTSNIVEKQELVQKVERLVANVKLEMEMEQEQEQESTAQAATGSGSAGVAAGAGGSTNNSGVDDNLCKICWDAATNVVFTPCGHLCTCLGCTEAIMKQERRECPICREFIKEYIRVFRA